MTQPKTSAAVEESLEAMKLIQKKGVNTVEVKKVLAICEKYKRMEDALKKISDGSGCPLHRCGIIAQESLDFDPL